MAEIERKLIIKGVATYLAVDFPSMSLLGKWEMYFN